MCDCVDVEIGSYANQVLLSAPPHMPKENGYCVDRCLSEEIQELWGRGVTTTGCCCGHNQVPPFIGVIEADIPIIKSLGYLVAPNPMRPADEDSFQPKSV